MIEPDRNGMNRDQRMRQHKNPLPTNVQRNLVQNKVRIS